MKFLVLMWAIFLMLSFTASETNPISKTYNLTDSTNLAKPGCESRCGDLIVPYPFGVGINSNCSINREFDIYCNTSSNPRKASVYEGGYSSIKQISDSTIRTSNKVATKCYSPDGNISESYTISTNYTDTPYTFSKLNSFIVIGCDDYGWLTSRTKSRNVSTGCIGFCSKPEEVLVNECSGNGCCQSSIAQGISYYRSRLNTILNSDNPAYKRSFNPCSYAFVGERSEFKFTGAMDLNDSSFEERIKATVPVVLEWAIGNLSCVEAETIDGYACQSNSRCVNSTRESGGYRCVCKQGYEGNPYLTPGCQDINECHDMKTFPCYGTCVNNLGNYTCKCKGGFFGDGKTRDGCRRKPFRSLLLFLGVGAFLGIGILVLAFWIYKVVQRRKERKHRDKFFKRNGGLLLQQQITNGEDAVERTRMFSAKDLEKATDQYNRNRIIGRGGQGTVYKGMLTDGKIVAVKKSKLVDENQVESFINEVFLLSQISHKNVVKLLGCCLETEVPILVYEFVPNGDLFQFIHDENYDFPTMWSMRLQIATEVAGALSYMHYATSIPIYHRDIKSSNILLDEKFRAKLSDFGISKSVLGDQTHLSTLVKGTQGYIDPEYFQSYQFTEKSDVYSFGIVLVELLTGKKPIFSIGLGESRSLATLILSTEEGLILENIDDRVLDGPKEQLIAVAKLAKRCLNLNGKLRPTMKEVATNLEGIRAGY